MKKRFGTFICLCLVLAVLLAPRAFAAEIIDSGYCGGEGDGTNLTWTLDSEGTLTISGEGAMADYAFAGDGYYAFEEECHIVKVIIEDGVTTIGRSAFFQCFDLSSITVPDGIISIGKNAFYFCEDMEFFSFPSSVTFIGEGAFTNCHKLSSIIVPAGVTNIYDSTFENCCNLISVTLPDGIAAIGDSAFSLCERLTSIAIPDSVTFVGEHAFSWCEGLTSITIPDNVTTIGEYIFHGCSNLTSVVLPKGITTISDGMFTHCESLASIIIPDTVTTVGEFAFYCCEALRSIVIPSSVTFIGRKAFSYCRNLTSIDLPDNLVSISEGVFQFCGIASITIPDSVTFIDNYAFADRGGCLEYIIFEGNAPVIEEYAFSGTATTVYYPADNHTWETQKLQDYNGDIIWVPRTEDMIYHVRFLDTDFHQGKFELRIDANRLKESFDDIAIIAIYSTEGKYLETILWQLTDATAQYFITPLLDNVDGKIGQIKVFILDSLSNPIPLAEAAEITSGT